MKIIGALFSVLVLLTTTAVADEKPTDKKRKKTEQIFKPSEEISEDLSVPFPTDI